MLGATEEDDDRDRELFDERVEPLAELDPNFSALEVNDEEKPGETRQDP